MFDADTEVKDADAEVAEDTVESSEENEEQPSKETEGKPSNPELEKLQKDHADLQEELVKQRIITDRATQGQSALQKKLTDLQAKDLEKLGEPEKAKLLKELSDEIESKQDLLVRLKVFEATEKLGAIAAEFKVDPARLKEVVGDETSESVIRTAARALSYNSPAPAPPPAPKKQVKMKGPSDSRKVVPSQDERNAERYPKMN